MCLPTHAAIATRYGSHVVTFESLSRSAAARMIGNGMCLPSVGSVVAWCCAYITPTAGDVPACIPPHAVLAAGTDCACGRQDDDSRGEVPDSLAWAALGALGKALREDITYRGLYHALHDPRQTSRRIRGLFPLPLAARDRTVDARAVGRSDREHFACYLDGFVGCFELLVRDS